MIEDDPITSKLFSTMERVPTGCKLTCKSIANLSALQICACVSERQNQLHWFNLTRSTTPCSLHLGLLQSGVQCRLSKQVLNLDYKLICIGVGSKFEVQRLCCATQSAAKKAAANFLKVSTFRLQNKAVFQRCITFQPRSQTLVTLKYNIQFMCITDIALTLSSFPGDRPPSFRRLQQSL